MNLDQLFPKPEFPLRAKCILPNPVSNLPNAEMRIYYKNPFRSTNSDYGVAITGTEEGDPHIFVIALVSNRVRTYSNGWNPNDGLIIQRDVPLSKYMELRGDDEDQFISLLDDYLMLYSLAFGQEIGDELKWETF